MPSTSALAETAALVGDPARANMLTALMDGRALTATELARAASITPQSASSHLARLTAANLLAVERQGRHRYHRLASPAVASMLEGIMALAEIAPTNARLQRPVVTGPRDAAMRNARTCYDHLAGKLAVAIADAMIARGHLELSPDGGAMTPSGAAFLRAIGVDLAAAETRAGKPGCPVFCRPCLDWSERRPHIAGAVGTALCDCCFQQGWVRRVDGTRALTITPKGAYGLRHAFGV